MKMIKKMMRLEILIFVSILLTSNIALANGIGTLSVGGDSHGDHGQDIFTYINAQNAMGVENMAIDFIYDGKVLTTNSVSSGSLANPTLQNIDNNLGKITLTYTGSNITGTGSIVNMSFHVIGPANSKSNLGISLKLLTDVNGNTLQKPKIVNSTFTVNSDTTPPNITAPQNIIKEAIGDIPYLGENRTSVNLGIATCTDDSGSCTITNDAPNGFSVGTTIVTWTAKDNSNNTATATQSVTITDNIGPVINIPSDIVAEATGILSKIDIGNATATDPVDPNPIVINDAPLNGLYPLGSTGVTWKAKDKFGNPSLPKLQIITVKDTTPPKIIFSNITKEATGPKTNASLGVTAIDLVDPNPILTNNSPLDGFPVGNTAVTWTAKDNSGNIATAQQYVTITDTTPPILTIPSNITMMANGFKTKIDIGNATAIDLVDLNPIVTNDAPSDLLFPIGVTKIIWSATDKNNNTITALQYITILAESGLSLSVDSQTKNIFPNDFATYNITINNTGLIGDTFNFVLNGTMAKENLNIGNMNIQLNPLESRTIELNTSDSRPGLYTTYVTATSIVNKSKNAVVTIVTNILSKTTGSGGSGGSSGGSGGGSSGGSSGGAPSIGGGGGGGGSVPSAEPFLNIYKSESRDRDLAPNVTVTYTFTTPDLGIYEAGITASNSDNDVPMKVELLKNAASGTSIVNTGTTYKYLNLYIGSKKITKVNLRFKVDNSWINNIGLSAEDIKLFRWDVNKWIGLATTITKNDNNYTYYEAQPDHFSSFAIVGLNPIVKNPVVIPNTNPVTTPIQTINPYATYIEEDYRNPVANIEDLKKSNSSNNGLIIGVILIVLVVAFFVKKRQHGKLNQIFKKIRK